jgi:hypothetical protein
MRAEVGGACETVGWFCMAVSLLPWTSAGPGADTGAEYGEGAETPAVKTRDAGNFAPLVPPWARSTA